MLSVTEGAKQMLKEALAAKTDDPELGLKLVANESGQFTLVLAQGKEGDQVVEHEGSKVLLIDGELSALLDGRTLDSWDSDKGRYLTVSKE
jgi:Fe-S cluster assembly iron-binding protein IscA